MNLETDISRKAFLTALGSAVLAGASGCAAVAGATIDALGRVEAAQIGERGRIKAARISNQRNQYVKNTNPSFFTHGETFTYSEIVGNVKDGCEKSDFSDLNKKTFEMYGELGFGICLKNINGENLEFMIYGPNNETVYKGIRRFRSPSDLFIFGAPYASRRVGRNISIFTIGDQPVGSVVYEINAVEEE